MAAPHEEGAPHLVQLLRLQVGGRAQRAHVYHQRIELALAQGLHQQLGAGARHLHVHAWPLQRALQQQRRHQHRPRARAQADAQLAFGAIGRPLAALAQLVCGPRELARPLQCLAAEGGELGVAADAVEQRLAELGLERADAAAERRLGDEQRRRRAAERAGLG